MSTRQVVFGVATALALGVLAAGTPAGALLTHNSLTHNGVASQVTALEELNGVAIVAVVLPETAR